MNDLSRRQFNQLAVQLGVDSFPCQGVDVHAPQRTVPCIFPHEWRGIRRGNAVGLNGHFGHLDIHVPQCNSRAFPNDALNRQRVEVRKGVAICR